MSETTQLFTDLSTEQAETVQGGGRCRYSRRWSSRPSYYSYRPYSSYSYYPSYGYSYGYSGYGGGYGAVSQSVNVNVQYDD
jgi:hypothetical protein